MQNKKRIKRIIICSLNEIPEFSSEDEEREWWETHDLAPELGEDVTEKQHALIRMLKAKHRYVPTHGKAKRTFDKIPVR
ncbi:MAG: hypothetical protein ACE5I1_32410 [bacterium]